MLLQPIGSWCIKMSGKKSLEGRTGPITQSVEAVKALLTWKGRAVDPLPARSSYARRRREPFGAGSEQ